MAEQVTLPAPITKVRSVWTLASFSIDMFRKEITIVVVGDDGVALSAAYPTPPPHGSGQPSGATLLNALNTANLSTNSLVKRIFNRLVADGYISGTVSGTPD